MATLAKLSIYLGLDSSGMSKGLKDVKPQLNKLESVVKGTFGRGAEGIAQFAAGFLSLNYALNRAKKGIKEIHDLKLAVDRVDNQSIDNATKAMERFEMSINRSAYAATAKLAPSLEVAANNATSLWQGIIGQDGVQLFTNSVNNIIAGFVNVQAVASSVAMAINYSYQVAWASIEYGASRLFESLEKLSLRIQSLTTDKFAEYRKPIKLNVTADLTLDKFNNDLKTATSQLKDAQKMFNDGLSGAAGRAYLADVEKARDAAKMQADNMANAAKSAEKMASFHIRDISPAALTKGSTGAASAITQARKEADTEAHKLMRQQLKELQAIRALTKPIGIANL